MTTATTLPATRSAVDVHRRGATWSLTISAAWIVLAVWRPTVTYHLAPLLIAGAWPYFTGARNRVDIALAAVGGFVLAIAAATIIWAVGAMNGPILWGDAHAFYEVAPAALIGAGLGYLSAVRHLPVTPDADN